MTPNEQLYTAAEAAAEVGVKATTIYTWVRRGYLTHAGSRGHHKLFRLADVFAAEANRKRQHRQRHPR